MHPFEPIEILTGRLVLRFLYDADLPALFDMFSHPEVARYLSWPRWTDRSQAQQMLADSQEGYRTGSGLQLGIERRADRALIGTCSLFHFHTSSRRAEKGFHFRAFLKGLLGSAIRSIILARFAAVIAERNF